MTSTILDISTLPRDLRAAAAVLGRDEARYLVDTYYQMQDNRMGSNNQKRDLVRAEEPHATIGFFGDQFMLLEKQVASALKVYAEGDPLGRWALSNYGIGPVITAGLLAHIDITKAPTVGKIWRFAGLDPTTTWEKGQKRPFNAKLKVLCWKIGESFKKFKNREDCFYGGVYAQRKEYEVARNDAVVLLPNSYDDLLDRKERTSEKEPLTALVRIDDELVTAYNIMGVGWFYGGNAKWAATTLCQKNIKDADTLARYREGRLPDGRLDLRATRYATKLFLSHYHREAYLIHYGTEPPLPYPIAHLGHNDFIQPPVPDVPEAQAA